MARRFYYAQNVLIGLKSCKELRGDGLKTEVETWLKNRTEHNPVQVHPVQLTVVKVALSLAKNNKHELM